MGGGFSLSLDSEARCEVTEGSEVTGVKEGHTWVQKDTSDNGYNVLE